MAISTKFWLAPALGFAFLLASPGLGAQTFEVGGSKYTVIEGSNVELTKYGGEGGIVTLPATVSSGASEYTLTKLGTNAFEYKMSVKQVVLPETVTEIGEQCFNTSGLESITMTDNVEIIGDYAFYRLDKLVTVKNFPKKLKKVGVGAFYANSGLTTPVYIAAGCELSNTAFQGCFSVKEITIAGEIGSIGDKALQLGGLQTININLPTPPEYDPLTTFMPYSTVEEFATMVLNVPIGAKEAYAKNTNWGIFGTINEIDFDGGGQFEDPYAKLTVDVKTPGSLESQIPAEAVTRVKELTLSGSLNGSDFAFIRGLASIEILDIAKAKIVKGGSFYLSTGFGTFYSSDDAVGEYMFYALKLKKVTLPESVTSIKENAFQDAIALETVTVGAATTEIGNSAFSGCGHLTEVNLPAGLQSLGTFCFSQCSSLADISLPESLKSLGMGAFYFCVTLNNPALPSSLETIGNLAFFNCASFTEITIPESVASIGEHVFDRCSKLVAIKVDAANEKFTAVDGVLYDKGCETVIRFPVGKKEAFFTFAETVNTIAPYAFYETVLESVAIPDKVETIGEGAFLDCASLTKATLSTGMSEIPNGCFGRCYALAEVVIPEGIKSVGTEAFIACALTEIRFPEGLKAIGEAAVWDNKRLQTVYLPSTLTTILEGAFYNDLALKEVSCLATVPPMLDEPATIFCNVDLGHVTLHVPEVSLERYQAAAIWQDFDIKADLSGIDSITADDASLTKEYYDLSGRRIEHPTEGIFIVRTSDGAVRKVVIR